MKITVAGVQKEVADGLTVAQLIVMRMWKHRSTLLLPSTMNS